MASKGEPQTPELFDNKISKYLVEAVRMRMHNPGVQKTPEEKKIFRVRSVAEPCKNVQYESNRNMFQGKNEIVT